MPDCAASSSMERLASARVPSRRSATSSTRCRAPGSGSSSSALRSPAREGKRIAQVWTSPKLSFLLRTPPDEFARQLTGGTFERSWRRGKFLIFDISGQHLVINPMLGGRLQWTSAAEKVAAATVFRITLEGGDELRFLDTVTMGRVYWVVPGALPTMPGWAELGPDRLTVGLSEFSQRIRRHPGELKNLLRNQAFLAGVGNDYS